MNTKRNLLILLAVSASATPLHAARRAPSVTPPPPVVKPITVKPVVSPI